MKKRFEYAGFLASLILLSSCNTVRNTVALSDIEGEWNIVEIDGGGFADTFRRATAFHRI